MANSDGFLQHSTKTQRTKILPLRWLANISGEFAGNHIVKAIDLDEDGNNGWRYRYHAKMWTILNKPYQLWGTYYTLDISNWNNE